ncbi:MAG: hypothetical protein COT73_13110 [Bdellovibrio sp. CG10_big_fil_rev_8_21_14_0_10_47_8]|nr:MAG: hypothetical protein COT73_13110 [Bdellovibrio sp. CG10_big_fil_rev_8_21_14_0_10_47_8]
MAFEDIKEQLQSELKTRWEQIQESSLYIQIKERYENLTPVMQKISLYGIIAVLLYLVLSFPLGYMTQSNDYVAEFEDKRQLIRDLLKSSRESQDVPNVQPPPSIDSLKAQVDNQLENARLLPEQIQGTTVSAEKSTLIPAAFSQGILRVQLAKLNLRQIIDLGHQFQNISPSVKMIDLSIEANSQDPRYFDVVYKLSPLVVHLQEETPEPPPIKKRGR